MSRSRTRHTTDDTDQANGHESTATMNPYETLHVEPKATDDDIKKAYRKLALRFHPDRLSSQSKEAQDEAKSKFQSISLAYSILIDPAKRKRYDLTGRLDSLSPSLADDPSAYFQDLYDTCVTPEAIAEFCAEYQGSTDERTDVLAAYVKHAGDMDGILSEIACSSVDDENRFGDMIREAIERGEVEAFKRFTHEDPKAKKKRKREAEREAKEAEEMARELGLKDAKRAKKGAGEDEEDALRQLILRNQSRRANAFESMMDRIENKYAANDPPKPSPRNRQSNGKASASRVMPPQKSKSRSSRKGDHEDEEEDELESDGDESIGSESAGSDESGDEEWETDNEGQGSSDEGGDHEEEQDEVGESEEEDELAAEPAVRRSSRKR